MRISDWSSDVCSSDLLAVPDILADRRPVGGAGLGGLQVLDRGAVGIGRGAAGNRAKDQPRALDAVDHIGHRRMIDAARRDRDLAPLDIRARSEEHTSELQSLMRISYAVLCLTKKK